MDIASLSTIMSGISVKSLANVSLIKMSMDGANQNLDTVTKMLNDSAVDQNLGKVIDVKV